MRQLVQKDFKCTKEASNETASKEKHVIEIKKRPDSVQPFSFDVSGRYRVPTKSIPLTSPPTFTGVDVGEKV